MTREGAIIILTNVASLLRDGTRYMKPEHEKQFREAYEMAIKALEQPEQRWIPCSERLPKAKEKHYWVCTDTGYQCQCRWTNINHFWTDLTTEWHWHIMDTPQYSKVIAWMPLPEPYGGEQDDA